jgi:TraX protein.
MSSSMLKIIAIVTMVLDHTAFTFLVYGTPEYMVLRSIGRLSFPIFCFLLAQGFVYTRNRKKYTLRMLIFALVSEWPYHLWLYGRARYVWEDSFNVFFELFLGLLAIACVNKAIKVIRNREAIKTEWWKIPVFTLCAAGIVYIAEFFNTSYGAYGILLIIGFYLAKENKILLGLVIAATTVGYVAETVIDKGVEVSLVLQRYAILACFPILLYNGKKGWNMPKYIFYVFYPLHILILYLIKTYMLNA